MTPRDDGSDKSRAITLVLGGMLGLVGAHRYYVGKIPTGLLQTFTFGGLGFWWMYDMILVCFGSFTDAQGLRVKYWTEDEAREKRGELSNRLPDELIEELDALRDDVADLNERMDFTERLLARGRDSSPNDR